MAELYIVDIKTLERQEIQFIPNEMSWPRNTKNGEVVVVGRNNPLNHYITGTETLNFKLSFHTDVEDSSDVIGKVRWLKSLTYNDGYNSERPKVRLVWGKLFKDEVWYVESVNPNLSIFDKTAGFLPQVATIDITFKLEPTKNLKRRDVR